MRAKNYFRIFMLFFMTTALICTLPAILSAEEQKGVEQKGNEKEVVVKEQEIRHEAGIYYTVQKGDTLWDLSERFFDSPALWPGLWQENHQIPNPHWIYPGEKIRLYHQSGAQPVKLIEKVAEAPKPPAEKKPEPKPEPFKEPPYYYYAPIQSIGFIRKVPVTPEGHIFQARDNKIMIGDNDIIYVKPGKYKTLVWGKLYTVYRTVESPRGKTINEYMAQFGVQHYLTGIIKIVDTEADYGVARVERSFRDIRVGDLLMPYEPRSPKIYLKESKQGVSGTIITSEDRDRMFGDHTVAFIDKGSVDGIEVGQFYSVFYREEHGFKFTEQKNKSELLPIDFGTILVLHTEESTATVLVTNSKKDLYPTASIRTPPRY